jgi:tetratricopeptide (TPR) repeat protein
MTTNTTKLLLAIGLSLAATLQSAGYVPREDLVNAGSILEEGEARTLDELTARGWYLLMDEGNIKAARGAFDEAISAGPYPAPEAALEGYGRSCEIRGDYDEAVRAYIELFSNYPDDPISEVYVHRASVLLENTNRYGDFVAALENLSADGRTPYLAGRANIYLYYLYTKRGDVEKAERALARFNPVDDWTVIGPFDNEGKSGFDEVYPPEKELNLSAAYDGKERPVRWRRIPYPPPGGFLDLRQMMRPEDFGCAYLVTSVRSPDERTVYVSMGTSGAYKVWLNGEFVAENHAYRDGYFDQDMAPVRLRAGENLLLIKLCGDDIGWTVGCRFLEENGKPITGLTYSSEPAAIATAKRTTGGPAPAVSAGILGGRDYFNDAIMTGSEDPFAYYYAAMYHQLYGDADRTDELPKTLALTAAQLRPRYADFHYFAGLFEPDENKSRAEFEKTTALALDHAEALLEIGKYYVELDRPESARDNFGAALAVNSSYVAAKQYLAKLDWEDAWGYKAKETVDAILDEYPDYVYALIISGLYYKEYESVDLALAEFRAAYNLDRTESFVHDQIYFLLLDMGRYDEASTFGAEIISADPYDIASRRTLGHTADIHGRYEEALAWYDEALEVCPEDYFTLAYKGLTLEKMGRSTDATQTLNKAIEYKHNYPWLADYLDYLEPKPETSEEYKLDAYQLLAEYPGDSYFPRDSAVYLLDQKTVEVFPNGTKSHTVHQVIRILTRDGAEKFRRLYITYTPESETAELLRTAVIKADGDEITATDVYESDVYDVWSRLYYSVKNKIITMPNLAPGDTIDFEYRVSDTGKNIFADYFGDTFTFGNENSTIKSEYTLILPGNREFYFHTVRGAPKPEVKREGDREIYRYTASDLSRVNPEPYAPKLAEILPLVQVSTFASWAEMEKWYNGLIKDVFKPTVETEAVAEYLSSDTGGELDDLVAVYNFVSRRVRYVGLEFGIGGYKPHKPKEVLDTAYGDCKDQATLIDTIAKSMGYEAYPVLLRTRDLGKMDYELPMLGLFNHMISYVKLPDGSGFFLDPTAEYNAYDELPDSDQGVNVFVIDGAGGHFTRTPVNTSEENTVRTETFFELKATGSAAVHRCIEYGKYYSPGQRYNLLSADNPRDIVEEFWNGLYAGTKVFNDEYFGIEEPFTDVAIEYDANVPAVFSPGDEQIILPIKLAPSFLVSRYGTQVTREYPLLVKDNYRAETIMTYVYADTLQPSVIPLTKELKSDFGYIKVNVKNEPGRLTVETVLEVPAQEISAENYSKFRQFCLDVDDWEAERFILVRR